MFRLSTGDHPEASELTAGPRFRLSVGRRTMLIEDHYRANTVTSSLKQQFLQYYQVSRSAFQNLDNFQ